MIILTALAAIGAIVLHALHPAGIYSVVSHISDGAYVTRVQAAASNAVNLDTDFIAICLFVFALLFLFGGIVSAGVSYDADGTNFQAFFGALLAAACACLALSITYHNFGGNQQQERIQQLQTQTDKWIATNLHVPNHYDFLDNKPYVERRPKGGDDVVVEATEGDFVKNYSTHTTSGAAIEFTITRQGDTYTVRVVK